MNIEILDELIQGQKDRMLGYSRKYYSFITPDDLLQPNDFPFLENNPAFRYEEGILVGLQQAKAALYASKSL